MRALLHRAAGHVGSRALRGVVSQVMPYLFGATTGVVAEHQAALQKAGGAPKKPKYTSMEGYLAAKVLGEGLRRRLGSGRQSRDGLVTALETPQNYNPGGFPLKFGPGRHGGSNSVELSMLTGDGRVRR